MRRNIFLYLFLFAALWIVFQYVNNVKVYENQEKRISRLEAQVQAAEAQTQTTKDALFDAEYFTVKGNENAYAYFENDGYVIDTIIPKIEDAIYTRNTKEGNDLIPFEGLRAPFRINKVQVLNHKWIIADFSDGERWGELFIGYEIGEGDSISFETKQSLIYPKVKDE
ncbi:hypothetical protein EAX61_05370 [Dokdonia sinensis]|uniref:Hydrolase n=1 Tax=Dokdonia sinensis TaxID=2479847 RepID=A0A3M0G7L8_9FLAO|nr:hypothetical protein [Dokdonia sinensis]RMB60914.1 hypothetical protein EAX61_05370 [Dokdonia sinensis]